MPDSELQLLSKIYDVLCQIHKATVLTNSAIQSLVQEIRQVKERTLPEPRPTPLPNIPIPAPHS